MDEGRHSVRDGERELRFEGELLGQSTSERPGKTRWAEISIYRTHAGKYVVAGIGRTIVPGEVQKYWAQVCERPEAVVERLHMLDERDSHYIPYVSKQALRQARLVDQGIANAYMVQVVD